MKRLVVWGLLVLMAAGLSPRTLRASNHADPLNLTDPNANITGLFIFPKDDQYILTFNVRKSLTFDSAEDRARYGGTIPIPDKLHPDVTIKVRLQDDTSLKSIENAGLKNTDKIRTFTGVRDDPFIFPRFFKKNVISMVMSIPKNAFPDDQQDFILWGATLWSWQAVGSRRTLGAQSTAALSAAECLRSQGSGAGADQGEGLSR